MSPVAWSSRPESRLLLLFAVLPSSLFAFNLDVHAPVYKAGPAGSYFGFSVAEHFRRDEPLLLVGAPKADSGQKGTTQAGALYACPLNTRYTDTAKEEWCSRVKAEYFKAADYEKAPDKLAERDLHASGKNHQLLGAAVVSQAKRNGGAVVCAPLTRFHKTYAYPEGVCYELSSELQLERYRTTCLQKNLPLTDRHNDYGACLEGFSLHLTNNTLVAGLPGARKWTGGVYAFVKSRDEFGNEVEKFTMGVQREQGGVHAALTSHDYLGFSVNIGRFGFAHEKGQRVTVVSGATRMNQTGAVVFLPLNRAQTATAPTSLTLTEDHFVLRGRQLGSGFGYSLAVLDLNSDGFDDLVVGAPFEHASTVDGQFGGAVYVFHSRGEQPFGKNADVFGEPRILRAAPPFAQFGLSLAAIGNLDGDVDDLQDFAVGAPFAKNGAGAVYIYHGSKKIEDFRQNPVQVIEATSLPGVPASKLKTFGFSLSGGADLDGNGYPDLLVGAFASSHVVLLRSRPVISLSTSHSSDSEFIDIEQGKNCPHGAKTCFKLSLKVNVGAQRVEDRRLIDFSRDVFDCNLEVTSLNAGINRRALIADSRSYNHTWKCGKNSNHGEQTYTKNIYVPSDRNEDWINPLSFKFSVRLAEAHRPTLPKEGFPIVNLTRFPILNKFGSSHEFKIPFNTQCGNDQVCQTDLAVKAVLVGVPQKEDGVYVSDVGNKSSLELQVSIENKGERAFRALLFVNYDADELEAPQLLKKKKKNQGTGAASLLSVSDGVAQILLGNPLEEKMTLHFDLSFKFMRGRGTGRPLHLELFANSTSEEKNAEDNEWRADVRLLKRAGLVLNAVSEPQLVSFGGEARGESAMELEEDIGPMVKHRYTITNNGPWSVSNVTAIFHWPFQLKSLFPKGEWALYLLDLPSIVTDNNKEVRYCKVDLQNERINPVEHIKKNTIFSNPAPTATPRRNKREVSTAASKTPKTGSFFRIKSKKVVEGDMEVDVVNINCEEGTAKCFPVTCHFDFIDVNSSSIVDFRARLWNASFLDYFDVEYLNISSDGRLVLDPAQGIEDDPGDNSAVATTRAYPDRPSIAPSIPWLYVLIAVLIGILLLLLLVFCLYKCGFFKRNRPEPSLHTAQLRHERELWG